MDAEGHLTMDVYIQLTETQQYLHKDSFHPGHCKESIPYCQVLRIHQICSKKEDFLQRTQELQSLLITWGYNEDQVQQQMNKTMGLESDELLLTKKIKTTLERVPLIVTYHPNLPPLKTVLNKHSSIITVVCAVIRSWVDFEIWFLIENQRKFTTTECKQLISCSLSPRNPS